MGWSEDLRPRCRSVPSGERDGTIWGGTFTLSENERRAADVVCSRDIAVRGGSALALILMALAVLLALPVV